MRRDDAVRILREHMEEIRAFGVRRVALFGSVARDEARDDSDVDVLVEFEGLPNFNRYMGLRCLLEDVFLRPIDLADARALKPAARPYIEQDLLEVA